MSVLAQLILQFPDLLALFVKESDVVALHFAKVADNEFECCLGRKIATLTILAFESIEPVSRRVGFIFVEASKG